MDLWNALGGMVRVRIVSADLPGVFAKLRRIGMELHDVTGVDELTVEFSVRRQDQMRLAGLAHRHGYDLELVSRGGWFWYICSLWQRPVLLTGLSLLMLLTMLIPTRILFVRVEGNVTIPARKIVEEAENCGLSFFSSRRALRSEKMKNYLLENIPELQWAGVNTYGCVAVISVRERSVPEESEENFGVTNLIATRDGIIDSITVTAGSALCTKGQAVQAGEVLISGYTDCGLSIRADRARGEVFAITKRSIEVITPIKVDYVSEEETVNTKYALIIGKKRINLYFGSGILDVTCGRMNMEYTLTLPGGFELPVGIVKETEIRRETRPEILSEEEANFLLTDFSAHYLSSSMIAGTVRSKEESLESDETICRLRGQYACHEMIAREQSEEIVKPYGTDH